MPRALTYGEDLMMKRALEESPSGHTIEHVVAESQAFILRQHLGTLSQVCHLNEGDQLIRVLEHLPQLAHVAQVLPPFLYYM